MIRTLRLRRRRAFALALSASVLVVAAPTASAATWEDLVSPDARDAATAPQQQAQSNGYTDLRSPDAREAALASQQAQSKVAYTDLRSPDARDAAAGVTTGSQPTAATAPVETRTVIAVEERGSQTLAIVLSAIALGIALVAAGFVAFTRRPRPRWTAP